MSTHEEVKLLLQKSDTEQELIQALVDGLAIITKEYDEYKKEMTQRVNENTQYLDEAWHEIAKLKGEV